MTYLNLKSAPHGWPLQNNLLNDPNSRYWGDRVEAAAAECAERFGAERWERIFHEVFPDGVGIWQETAETIERILEVTDLDCTCPPIGGGSCCDGCKAYSDAKYGDSIPWKGE